MSILTGLVIVVAMATLAQRSDSLFAFFTRETPPRIAPQNDEAAIFAGDSQVIDVLENDLNAKPEDGENIRIVVSPSCGAAEATSEGVLYISNELCVGPQLFAYCVEQGEECLSASVTVNVASRAPGAVRVETEREEAQTPSMAPRASVDERPATPDPATRVAAAPATAPAQTETEKEPSNQPADGTSAPRLPSEDLPTGGMFTSRAPLALPTEAAPDHAEADAPVGDQSAPPRIGAAPDAAGGDGSVSEAATAQGQDPVVAAIRPTAPSGLLIGRLADAPRIIQDDGGAPPEPAAPAEAEAAPAEMETAAVEPEVETFETEAAPAAPVLAPSATPVPAPRPAPTVDEAELEPGASHSAPTLSATLSDDSEPQVALAPSARPRFEDTGAAVASTGAAEATQAPIQTAALPSASRTETSDWTRPDVTAIEGAPAEAAPEGIKVARLPEPVGGSTADWVEDDAVRALREAATESPAAPRPPIGGGRPGAPAPGAAPAPVSEGCGEPTIRSIAFAGASSRVEIGDACRAGETFELVHAGLRFGGRLDETGAARLTVPVMAEDGAASLRFADGSATPVKLDHNWRELKLTLRVAVAWTDPVDLDLHAFEYAASFNADGHVWSEHPGGFRRVRRSGGGYLENFPAVAEGGQSIEVYTFWANSRARRGVARIALDLASRGDVPSGDYCAGGALATPEYVVVRSERGELESTARGRFAAARCGKPLDEAARYASGALRDLRIE